ncbi:hypothetical protein D0Z07_4633 [Hyphodiscus hymeniophilus]|uniref:Uncharacterized protein n=1 Tax=Hyphodiscus hymeniophilus TaxID=353542 RepID=A0A9P6VIS6_9HELO|nr:hypothetical protein D0Z07_4633 [Hyphodiscus hymeniophilus]
MPLLFVSATLLLCATYQWPRRWTISGAPLLQLCILQGEANGLRILPLVHLWPLLSTLNLVYAIASTSWLLYGVFAAACYPTIFIVCLFQFGAVSRFVRRNLRAVIKQLHFIDDKIAFFNIPALEIDTEVDGLMVLRGITFSLSTLSFVVHGVEVGIKLSDDMELAIQTEKVTVSLFRKIEVGDCFANLKGGEYEMTFATVEKSSTDEDGNAVFVADTPLLRAASGKDGLLPRPEMVKMTSQMTDGNAPIPSPISDAVKGVKQITPDNETAGGRYRQMLDSIDETSTVQQARKFVISINKDSETTNKNFDNHDANAMRAAICSQLHSKPSVPHPPRRSIKVTTLQNLSPTYVRGFLHRLPMLLRLLLNPLSYFHPVYISSITATASGRWIETMLVQKIFKDYGETDSELKSLKARISSWLSDASFVVELANIIGLAQVPFLTSYDINCSLAFEDVMTYRALPKSVNLNQVLRLGGADARFVVPTFLLPHHEHLVPPVPTQSRKESLSEEVETADGKPKEIQTQHTLEQVLADETNVKISVHARLPACFDQELLDFVAALVKATKVVEIEKAPSAMDEEVHGVAEFAGALKGRVKEGVKKAVVDGIVNDRWIAKMVGKLTTKLEEARGDLGYSGDIPVELGLYRNEGWNKTEGEKLLP